MSSIFWFRRDLRLEDNLALLAAAEAGEVLPVFIFSKPLTDDFDRPRIQFLVDSLKALSADCDSKLSIRFGDPTKILAELSEANDGAAVFSTKSWSTYSVQQDREVGDGLAKKHIEFHLIDSPYAVAPGQVFNKSGLPFRVYSPFYKAWSQFEIPEPVPAPKVKWISDANAQELPATSPYKGDLPAAGEEAAHAEVNAFLENRVFDYSKHRNYPGIEGTSKFSPYLKWGTLHPRQLLARLGDSKGEEVFRKEIAWREFYGTVLHHWPETATEPFSPKMAPLQYNSGPDSDDQYDLWEQGQTGYPIVDAGIRELVATGWMHNRVRMIVASFLTKDLHIDWQRGAAFFMHHLADGDLASNSHGWQWTAGTGTDASPYFRVFNPVTQSRKFDEEGDYLRKWIPEIAHLPNKHIHEPWNDPHGAPAGYPGPLVDHAEEREEALKRYEELKNL